jgi:hypothetical protein
MAATNPRISKLSSFAEQSASPLITGISDRLTYRPVASPEEGTDKTYDFGTLTGRYLVATQPTVRQNKEGPQKPTVHTWHH